MKVKVYEDILKANDQLAGENRRRLNQARVFAVNMIGSPGSGKTTLIEALLSGTPEASRNRITVIEGDVETSRDAERVAKLGVRSLQINTHGGCHLTAGMVGRVIGEIPLAETDLIIIENVGNLVCPSDFDVGEHMKIAVLSAPEGDDKPAKYPVLFRTAKAVVLTKLDLAEASAFSLESVRGDIRSINAPTPVFETVPRTGEGVAELREWLFAERERLFG